MDMPSQHTYYVVQAITAFASFQAAAEQAPDLIAAHIARSKELHASGTLLMSGAFLDHSDAPLTTMAILSSREEAEAYITGDPFVQQGMVRSWSIREWANMFA